MERAGLAQLVAHPTCNRKVTGSSPVAGPTSEVYLSNLRRSRTAAMASTREIAQLAQSNHICQLKGDLSVFRKSPIPAVTALRMEALKKYSRMFLA